MAEESDFRGGDMRWHLFETHSATEWPVRVVDATYPSVQQLNYCFIELSVCPLLVVWNSDGVVRTRFLVQQSAEAALAALQQEYPSHRWQAVEQDPYRMAALFEGQGPALTQPIPLVLSGTPFQRAVWATLLKVPSGQVTSYGALACASGFPRASRAVGHAMATNPIPWLVPCHRVIRHDGQLGHYSYGSDLKRQLLNWEAAMAQTKESNR
jgi:AraC family transcriptional regulator of adaptative response/methylated-DNA-[protein]-cysteine methyltransferase